MPFERLFIGKTPNGTGNVRCDGLIGHVKLTNTLFAFRRVGVRARVKKTLECKSISTTVGLGRMGQCSCWTGFVLVTLYVAYNQNSRNRVNKVFELQEQIAFGTGGFIGRVIAPGLVTMKTVAETSIVDVYGNVRSKRTIHNLR